jgi:hypothetical protein
MHISPRTRNALLALGITILLFATVLGSIRYLDSQRVAELAKIQSRIAIDTLSLETQFDLLAQAPCEEISEKTVLSTELNDLADRLSFTEERLGSNNEEVLTLKRQYTLLEIKDYLLMKRLTAECGLKPVFVLYFYSNEEGECETCEKAGYALSYLRETYPSLRVYSFDYNLDLSALHTLIAVLGIKHELPAFVIDGKAHYGLDSREAFEETLPLEKLSTSTEEM